MLTLVGLGFIMVGILFFWFQHLVYSFFFGTDDKKKPSLKEYFLETIDSILSFQFLGYTSLFLVSLIMVFVGLIILIGQFFI